MNYILELGTDKIRFENSNKYEPIVIKNQINYYNNHSLMIPCNYQKYSLYPINFYSESISKLCRPIKDGKIIDWNSLNLVIQNLLNKENKNIENSTNFLLTHNINMPKNNKYELIEYFFEKYNINNIILFIDSVLGLYSKGKTTGLVVDCGFDLLRVFSVYEGFLINSGLNIYKMGAKNINNELKKIISNRMKEFNPEYLRNPYNVSEAICEFVKEEHSKINFFNQDIKYLNEIKEISLPDGQIIKLRNRDLSAPTNNYFNEFGKNTYNKNYPSLENVILNSMENLNYYQKKDLYSNIALMGGSSKISNFEETLNEKLSKIISKDYKVNFIADIEENSCWFGGYQILDSGIFNEFKIKKSDYNEYGKRILDRINI